MSPTVELATTPTEEQALLRADALPTGEPTELAGGVVVAGPIYAAASGRRCREMTIGARRRLACEALQSESWVFVPDVFTGTLSDATGGEAAVEGAPPVEETAAEGES